METRKKRAPMKTRDGRYKRNELNNTNERKKMAKQRKTMQKRKKMQRNKMMNMKKRKKAEKVKNRRWSSCSPREPKDVCHPLKRVGGAHLLSLAMALADMAW